MSHPNRGFLAPKWVTHHFWEIHICGAAPLSINAILPICEGLIAARMTLCAVVNTSHPHIPETHQKSRMKAFVGWRQIEDFGLEMRCGRVRLTLFFPLHNSNFLYQIENVVCYPFRTANLVDNGTKEGQIGEGWEGNTPRRGGPLTPVGGGCKPLAPAIDNRHGPGPCLDRLVFLLMLMVMVTRMKWLLFYDL